MQNSVILGILFRLLRRNKITAAELAERFEVSTRTIHRYLVVLEGAGVPIEREVGRGGGIKIMDSFRLDRTYFSKEERQRLADALKLTSPAYSDTLNDVVLDKLSALCPSDNDDRFLLLTDTLVIDSSGWNNASAYRHIISAVNEGIYKQLLIRLRYKDRNGEVSERLIEPHTLVLKEGIFYLYAFCHMRGSFRMFRLSRVSAVSLSKEQFERRPIDGYAWNTPFDTENMITITLTASSDALPEIEEWLNVTEGADGTIRALVPDTLATVRKLLSYSTDIKIISPEKIRTRLIEEAKKIQLHA